MKRLLLSGLMGLALLPPAAVAVDAFYINSGTVLNPQVDAINFVNKGLFQASGSYPYETFSTLNYTNKVGTFSGSGTMDGSPGFRFDTCSSATGMRTMASSFFNDNGAVVEATDPFAFGFVCVVAPVGPSYLLVSATNIVVKAGTSGSPKASLIVGPNGELELTGKNIDLTRSGLEVMPVWDEVQGSGNGDTNFIPDIAVADLYWGRTNFTHDYPLFSARLWNGTTARAPYVPWPEVQPGGASGFTLPNPEADSYINELPDSMMTVTVTNQDGSTSDVTFSTNITKGAVFVGVSGNAAVLEGFTEALNGYDTIGVLFSVEITNVVTTQMEPAYIYFEDRLASGGTTGILTSVVGCPPYVTSRPANYYLTRVPFYPGDPGNNGYPTNSFFLKAGVNDPHVRSDGVTNSVVESGEYSAYGAYSDNMVTRPPPVAGGTVTNLPGRIHISSDRLDMTRTRLRAEGEIIIQTSHLISSSNAVVDCENLSFNLASTNGNLKVQNLSKDSVDRFLGSIYAWSAVWSNLAVVVLKNYKTNDQGVYVLDPLTNTVTIGFHTLMLDARDLGAWAMPVTVYDFTTHSTNVVISDNVSVGESLLIDGKSLTLDGNLTIPGTVPVVNPIYGYPPPGEPFQDWTFANVPNLLYFTNHGTFSIANEAHFGDDRAAPYSTFVNTGTVSAASIALNSVYFENRGSLVSVGPLFMQCASGKLEGGGSSSGGDSHFLAGSLKFNQYNLTVNGGLYFLVTNALFDAGGGSGNVFNVLNGFNLQAKPQTGDLLGTTLETTAPDVPSIWLDHTWAGADRGPNAAGYTNNTALGTLQLSAQSPDPFFYFSGTGAQNGLYVDLLDLSALGANYENLIAIDPSLVIYFAAAKLGLTPPQTNGVPPEAEEYLDGQFNGHLRWVRDFAGPNSSVAVVSNGVSIMVNRALRYSLIIDSNGNGIPNGLDFFPFDTAIVASLKVASPPPSTASLSWNAIAGKVYRVEATTNVFSANWQTVLYYTNSAATNGIVTAKFPVSPGVSRQYYRVGTTLP
jgi:hypothetical protein